MRYAHVMGSAAQIFSFAATRAFVRKIAQPSALLDRRTNVDLWIFTRPPTGSFTPVRAILFPRSIFNFKAGTTVLEWGKWEIKRGSGGGYRGEHFKEIARFIAADRVKWFSFRRCYILYGEFEFCRGIFSPVILLQLKIYRLYRKLLRRFRLNNGVINIMKTFNIFYCKMYWDTDFFYWILFVKRTALLLLSSRSNHCITANSKNWKWNLIFFQITNVMQQCK